MKTKWIIGLAMLSLVTTVLSFHIYIDGEPKPVIKALSDLRNDSDDPDIWSHNDTLTKITNSSGRYENPVWSPDGMSIAFECEGWIHLADVDKGEPYRLVEGFDPAFSPAGNEVLFVRPIELVGNGRENRANGIEVLAVDLIGKNVRNIARLEDTIIANYGVNQANDYLVCSPSKRMAALRVYRESSSMSSLAIWDIENGTLKHVDSSSTSWPPSWSLDEQELVCSRTPYDEFGEGRNPKPDLWLIDAETCELTNLTNTPDIREGSPLWSTDGSEIAFTSFGPGFFRDFSSAFQQWSDVCTIKPDGTARNILTNRIYPWNMRFENEHILSWAPDNSSVAYFKWGLKTDSANPVEISQELWEIGGVVHHGSSGIGVEKWNPLIRAPLRDGFIGDISWSPKGDKIAFEWTLCDITAINDSFWGAGMQVDWFDAPTQVIYVVDVPEESGWPA